VRDLQRKINEIVRLKKEKIENQEFEKAVELRDQEEDIRRQIDTLKQEWEDAHDEREIVVTEEDMAYVVSRMTGIPLSKIEEGACSIWRRSCTSVLWVKRRLLR